MTQFFKSLVPPVILPQELKYGYVYLLNILPSLFHSLRKDAMMMVQLMV